jgi:hypothetical protein
MQPHEQHGARPPKPPRDRQRQFLLLAITALGALLVVQIAERLF